MTRHVVTQRSLAWYQLRCGHLTGSCADDMLSLGKAGKESISRRDLRIRLAAERLTGRAEIGGYVSAEMQRGIDMEPVAVMAYEVWSGRLVDTSVGYCEADDREVGYSPDGLCDEGLIEFKCPKTATHLRYLTTPGALVADYRPQLLHGLWVTGAKWVDIMSFDDRLPARLAIYVERVDAAQVPDYALAATLFLSDVDTTVDELLALAGGVA